MSISAFTTWNRNCQVNITWLRQNFFLKPNGNGSNFLEFVIDVKSGFMDFIDIYFPYEIIDLENITPSILKPNEDNYAGDNKAKYNLISSQDEENGRIMLFGKEIIIKKVYVSCQRISNGNKLHIQFSKTFKPGEKTAVRVIFDIMNLSVETVETVEDVNTFSLRYYTVVDASKYSLESAANIYKYEIQVFFPYRSVVYKGTPVFTKEKTWTEIHSFEHLDIRYGHRAKEIINRLPIDVVEWLGESENNKPLIKSWEPLHFKCRYTIKPELIICPVNFPPAIRQACLQIVNFLGEIFIDKFPSNPPTLDIKQKGPEITIIVEPNNDTPKEIVIATLTKYGLVVRRKLSVKEFTDNPVLRKKLSLFLQSLEEKGKHLIKFEPEAEKEKNYVVYANNSSGIKSEQIIVSEKNLTEYLLKKDEYDIFVYQQNVYKKVYNKYTKKIEVQGPLKLDATQIDLLVLFLKYKDEPIPFYKLYNLVWKDTFKSEPQKDDSHSDFDVIVMNRLTTAVSTTRKNLEDVKGFKIPNSRKGCYTCNGHFKFCLILTDSLDCFYTFQEV